MSDTSVAQDTTGAGAGAGAGAAPITTTAQVAAAASVAAGTSSTTPSTGAAGGSTTSTNVTTATGATVTVALTSTQQMTMIPVATIAQSMAASSSGLVAVTQALTQIVASSPQVSQIATVQAPSAGAVIRSSLPQGTVQVIQHPFVQQQYMQQQYYIQNVQGTKTPAYISAMQAQPVAQQVNLAPVQGRPQSVVSAQAKTANGNSGQKSPVAAATQAGSHATVTLRTVASPFTTVAATQTAKSGKTVVQQQAVFGNKQVLRGAGGQPVVIGQLGVLSNPGSQQTLVAQPKSPSVSIAQGGQIINSPTQIRLTTPPTFVTSQGQILSGTVTPAMLNQLQMATIQPNSLPLGSQQVQSAIIGTQPLYLRPAGTLQTQQGIMGRVQAVLPNKGIRQGTDTGTVQMKSTGTQVKTVTPAQVKGVANILPQTARPAGVVPGSPTTAKAVQTGQGKQVSRVRALKPQVRTSVAQQVVSGQARIAPQQVTTARILTPTMTRPPTVLVQPKPQVTQRPAAVTTHTSSTAVVTAVPIATVPSTQSQPAPVPETRTSVDAAPIPVPSSPAASPEKSAPPIPIVSPIKSETATPVSEEVEIKPEEPMETETPTIGNSGPGVIGTGAPGMVGAGAGPDRSAGKENDQPPKQNRPGDRSDRIATVIGERQAAVVRPNVLTHVIEGFVIQEAPEPFPVQRCSALSDFIASRSSEQENDSALEKEMSDSSDFSMDSVKKPIPIQTDDGVRLKCEFCGKVDLPRRFRRSGRFCSNTCAKRYNVGCSRRINLFKAKSRSILQTSGTGSRKKIGVKKVWNRSKGGRVSTGPLRRNPDEDTLTSKLTVGNVKAHLSTGLEGGDLDTDHGIGMSGLGAPSTMSMETTTTTSSESERSTSPSGQDESSSPRSPPELEPEMDLDTMASCTPRRHLSKWTVQEVVDFVRNLPGCGMYAEEFNRQEIDGQALMLLKEDHLMSAMSIKLGPALKICSKITSLKDEVH